MSWSPAQYEKFKAERRQPFVDLLSLIERKPHMRVADLGCGTGDLTKELHESLDAAQTLGIDDSAAMLARAAAAAGETLQFAKADIASFAPDETYDLLFSNAALHWVADHEQLLARLRGMLAPGGQLAIQMPANDDHPSHSVAAVLAVKHGATAHPDFLLPVERYATLLHELGFTRQHVRLQVYGHLLPSTADVVEWVRGALLTDYEARLGERFGAFLEDYRTELPRVLGDERPFFYTYKRVLIWAGL